MSEAGSMTDDGEMAEFFDQWPETPAIKINNPQVTRLWPYDGPEGRARLTGSLDTGGSFTGGDEDDPVPAEAAVRAGLDA